MSEKNKSFIHGRSPNVRRVQELRSKRTKEEKIDERRARGQNDLLDDVAKRNRTPDIEGRIEQAAGDIALRNASTSEEIGQTDRDQQAGQNPVVPEDQ